jgi:hypothetical protein
MEIFFWCGKAAADGFYRVDVLFWERMSELCFGRCFLA